VSAAKNLNAFEKASATGVIFGTSGVDVEREMRAYAEGGRTLTGHRPRVQMCPIGAERKFAAAQRLGLESWGTSAVTTLAALQIEDINER
jgi:hypothetical protein